MTIQKKQRRRGEVIDREGDLVMVVGRYGKYIGKYLEQVKIEIHGILMEPTREEMAARLKAWGILWRRTEYEEMLERYNRGEEVFTDCEDMFHVVKWDPSMLP